MDRQKNTAEQIIGKLREAEFLQGKGMPRKKKGKQSKSKIRKE